MLGNYIGTVRRNHALEHATVTLLLSKLGPDIRLVGRATGDGFLLFGDVPTEALRECVTDALARLKKGEGYWAVTPLCGTNLVSAGVLASLSTMAVIRGAEKSGKKDRLPNVLLAGVIGVTVAQPLGRLLQKHITTSPDLQDTEIIDIEARSPSLHKVKTLRRPAAA
jgi:uncharacterized protein DUF6391